jgi:uncharacterized protein (TIGR02270 family)
LRAAGELGRTDVKDEVKEALSATNQPCRFWAAWTYTLFGEEAATQVLWDTATREGPFRERAATMAVRRMDGPTAVDWVYRLACASPDLRVPLSAATAAGDPLLVPWLLEAMRSEEGARLAGRAFTMLTGVDLRAEELATLPPHGRQLGPTDDPADDHVAVDPDEGMAWPDPAKVSDWWCRHRGEFQAGTRYVRGVPVTIAGLERVLRTGDQPARTAAAVELSLREPGRAVFEVRGPGFLQRRNLGL